MCGQMSEGQLDMSVLKKFVAYCRTRCAPRLSPEAGRTLASEVSHTAMPIKPQPSCLRPFLELPMLLYLKWDLC